MAHWFDVSGTFYCSCELQKCPLQLELHSYKHMSITVEIYIKIDIDTHQGPESPKLTQRVQNSICY